MRVFEPSRNNYKKTYTNEGCVFCEPEPEVECPGLHGEHWFVRANRFPYMDGNVMIMPTRHVVHTADLTAEEWKEFGEVLVRVQSALGRAFGVNSFNIGMNMGPDSGASIPHLHWQVVPRKVTNLHAMNVFADFYVVSTTSEDTKRMLDEAAAADEGRQDIGV